MSQPIDCEFPVKLKFLFEPARYKVAYGGRGAAKSWGFARALLIQAWQKPLRVLCTREVQNSIRDSVHRLLSDQAESLGLGSFYTIKEKEIVGANGSEFFFAGLSHLTVESVKSYEGVDICWVEEAHAVRQRSWDILTPTIRKSGSEIWVSMNPELDTDESYQRFIAHPPEGAVVVEMNWRDNPWFPEVLEQERKDFQSKVRKGTRSQDDYDNIWEGKPRAAIHGAIFARELAKAKTANRIGVAPYDPGKLVLTAWDIGKGDPTAIWFFQQYAGAVQFIRYFEDRGEEVTYYLEKMTGFGYRYGTCFLPHDAKQDRLGAPKTVERTVIDNGFNVQVIPVRSLKDQINEARLLFARARFHEEDCKPGLEALRHYRWGFNQAMQELKSEPVHDWASHGASAFMGAAMSFRLESEQLAIAGRPPIKHRQTWNVFDR